MKPRINVLTIGVNDLGKSLKFYRDGLGLKTQGIVGTEFEHGAVVFIDLSNGMKLALYPRKEIAWDAKIPHASPSATEFTIGHLVNSKEEVDAVMVQAKKAGAKITKPAKKTFWGGKFKTVMAAKDKSASFDFTGTYTAVKDHELIEYTLDDGRRVKVEFAELPEGVKVTETFEPETANSEEVQRSGWQAILDNFKKYVEGGK